MQSVRIWVFVYLLIISFKIISCQILFQVTTKWSNMEKGHLWNLTFPKWNYWASIFWWKCTIFCNNRRKMLMVKVTKKNRTGCLWRKDRTLSSFSSGSIEQVLYTSTPPGFTNLQWIHNKSKKKNTTQNLHRSCSVHPYIFILLFVKITELMIINCS